MERQEGEDRHFSQERSVLSAESPPGTPLGESDRTGQGNIAGALCHLLISTCDPGVLRDFEISNYFL